jgi:hypothetical protein
MVHEPLVNMASHVMLSSMWGNIHEIPIFHSKQEVKILKVFIFLFFKENNLMIFIIVASSVTY